jgi:hypothetical protein
VVGTYLHQYQILHVEIALAAVSLSIGTIQLAIYRIL